MFHSPEVDERVGSGVEGDHHREHVADQVDAVRPGKEMRVEGVERHYDGSRQVEEQIRPWEYCGISIILTIIPHIFVEARK